MYTTFISPTIDANINGGPTKLSCWSRIPLGPLSTYTTHLKYKFKQPQILNIVISFLNAWRIVLRTTVSIKMFKFGFCDRTNDPFNHSQN